MADNVTYQSSTLATPPSGTEVSADEDVTNGLVQRVKLAVSADGSSTHIGADANGLQVQGGAADDAAAAGNPVQMGAVAKETDGTDPGNVTAEGDATGLISDLNRRLLVNEAHPFSFNANENHATAQTNNSLQGAPGAGLHIYITDVMMSYEISGTIKLVEDTGGTPADVLGPFYFAALGGLTMSFKQPIRLSENVDLGFTSVNNGNHTIFVSGYIGP